MSPYDHSRIVLKREYMETRLKRYDDLIMKTKGLIFSRYRTNKLEYYLRIFLTGERRIKFF